MQKYIEIAIGVPSNRGKIIKEENLNKEILKARKNNDALYKSYYSFDEDILKHFEIYKTISSYKGKFYLDKIIIDIDKGRLSDENVWLACRAFIENLEDQWQLDREQIGIWYSGTGYHISIPNIFAFEPSYFLPDEVKATINKYFPEMADIKPLIRTGLIRIGFTVNKKNGLYKIPLTYEEFNSGHKNIIELSSKGEIRKLEVETLDNIPNFHHLVVRNNYHEIKEEKTDPTRIITCVQKIFNEGAVEGNRHVNLIRLVSVRRRNGNSLNEIMEIAKVWNSKNKDGLIEKELERQVKYIWEKGYTPSCDDDILKKYCDSKCIYYQNKNLVTNIDSSEDMEIAYIQEIRNPKRMIINLPSLFNSNKKFNIIGGEVVYIIGDTGLGKTALAQNIITRLKQYNVLYLNLEISDALFYRRLIQIDNNMTKEDVENYYKENNNTLSEGVKHIKTINQPIDLMTLRKIIAENNYNILFVDVLEKIKVKNLIGNDKIDAIGEELRSIANKYKIAVLGVHHISKASALDKEGNSKALTVHSGKYASSLEQSADQMLGLSGVRDSSLRFLQSLKARDENSLNMQLAFNVNTFKMDTIGD